MPTPGHPSRGQRFRFALTAFLSAFLLFQIQPMVSKRILPWYGGTPAVWTTCLLFFQFGLLAGYAYAHLSIRFLSTARQTWTHGALLVAAMFVPVLPGPEWSPSGTGYPPARILAMLLTTVGLPYMVLSATSPLIQAWAARLSPGRVPWHLFATSNAGSLLALASYPILVEPSLTLRSQAKIWGGGFAAFALVCATILWSVWRSRRRAPKRAETGAGTGTGGAGPAPETQHAWLWISWSACGVVLFMAVTNQLTLNIASMPFLWVLPLSIYLLSFIVTFSGTRWYPRRLAALLLGPAVAAFYLVLPGDMQNDSALFELDLIQKTVLSALALFVCCVVCHGELYRTRPPGARLTRFYLSIATGGLIGGTLVGIVAPRFFLLQHELMAGLLGCGILFLITARRDPHGLFPPTRSRGFSLAVSALLVATTAVSVGLTQRQLRDAVYTKRNFFGLLRVMDVPVSDINPTRRMRLFHGSTLHGLQLVHPDLSQRPTLYYGPISGVGVVLQTLQRPNGRRVGVVGMGIATVASYGRPNDHFRFYEIDPDVAAIAEDYFSFLHHTPAAWDVRLGDARLSLERDEDQNFDILILDAFSSDSIPVHLLTVEAMDVYARHLNQDGVIVIHTSNRYLELGPVVDNVARRAGFQALHVANDDEIGGPTRSASWTILARERALLYEIGSRAQLLEHADQIRFYAGEPSQFGKLRVWTDGYSSLARILR